MIRVFTVAANAVTPASVKIPSNGSGFRQLDLIPPSGHAWTLYDPDAANGVPRSTDFIHPILRRDRNQQPFLAGATVCKVLLDSGSGNFLCILS